MRSSTLALKCFYVFILEIFNLTCEKEYQVAKWVENLSEVVFFFLSICVKIIYEMIIPICIEVE